MSTRALLVIDVQNEYEEGPLRITHPPLETSLAAIGRAMDAAQDAGIAVVVVQQDAPDGTPVFAVGSHGWQLHPVVAARPADHHVHKLLPGAFTGTDLEEWLRARGVDTVTIVGCMTHNCVAATAQQATHARFAVEVLSDATGTLGYANAAGSATAEEMQRVHLATMHARFGAVGTTDEWIAAVRAGATLRAGTTLRLGNLVASAASGDLRAIG